MNTSHVNIDPFVAMQLKRIKSIMIWNLKDYHKERSDEAWMKYITAKLAFGMALRKYFAFSVYRYQTFIDGL